MIDFIYNLVVAFVCTMFLVFPIVAITSLPRLISILFSPTDSDDNNEGGVY